ncbi:MAG: hypothetical protein LBC73_07850, partial [Oscillospiraceae bacterium]|nr:hypothetical protein [Oscillospiraceae bacterium]
MEYTYQFFSGGYEAGVKDCAADVVLDKLYQKFGFGDVIIGWNTQDKCYQRIIEVAHKAGKKVWLWMPVFSELPSYAKADPVIDYQNKLQQGLGVLPDEDFRFVCPSSQNNIDIIFNLYQKHFADLPFDGVFLDKIRHSSYANGLSGGMGCFCKNCTKIYQEEGVNTQEVINKINKSPAKLLPLSQINGKYIFKDPLVDNFYQAKADIITESILKLVIRFENSGLSVALDLFAPVLAYLVGQDIPELSKNV